ncbi:zinc finger protein 43 [Nematostella vectensis]|uniref:zinc finger protein 43 n=1 Tax=Nematostella vectensis TaxID=45351 RepID=UPI0020771542|nr:zinc finger protein 43 [Nematostella vectensis]
MNSRPNAATQLEEQCGKELQHKEKEMCQCLECGKELQHKEIEMCQGLECGKELQDKEKELRQCLECGKELQHKEKELRQCLECGKELLTSYNLKRHVKTVQKQENLYKCEYYHKHFGQKHNLKRHVDHLSISCSPTLQVGPKSNQPQALLSYVHASSQKQLAVEPTLEKRRLRKVLLCEECKKEFSRKGSLETSTSQQESLNLQAGQSLDSQNKLQVSTLLQRKVYLCEECEKEFPRKDNLVRHVKTVHRKKKRNLKQHLPSAHPVAYDALNKDTSSSQQESLNLESDQSLDSQHKLQVSALLQRNKQVGCMSNQRRALLSYDHAGSKKQVPIEPTHGKRPRKVFQCVECGKEFPRKDSLVRHVKTVHRKEKRLIAHPVRPPTRTETSTSQQESLKLESGQTFDSQNKHQVSTLLQRYKCKECRQCFHRYDYLQRHIKVVHRRDRPFSCEHCDKSYGHMTDLRKHIKKQHKVHSEEGQEKECNLQLKTKRLGRERFL